jgi:spore maturation protein CgeB
MDGLQEFLEIVKEIVCCNTSEDFAAKIKYYLSHESECENIRKAGGNGAEETLPVTSVLNWLTRK